MKDHVAFCVQRTFAARGHLFQLSVLQVVKERYVLQVFCQHSGFVLLPVIVLPPSSLPSTPRQLPQRLMVLFALNLNSRGESVLWGSWQLPQ
jgi:hypothetical protein